MIRVPDTAVYFTGRPDQAPQALLQLARRTGVVHERVIVANVIIEPVARVEAAERLELTPLGEGFYRLVLRYGFMQLRAIGTGARPAKRSLFYRPCGPAGGAQITRYGAVAGQVVCTHVDQ